MEYQMTCILNKGQESCDTSVVLIQLSFMNNRVTKCFSSKFPSKSLSTQADLQLAGTKLQSEF